MPYGGDSAAVTISGNIIIKSDCKSVVEALVKPENANCSIAPIIQQIRSKAGSLKHFVCIHVGRNWVYQAHVLAVTARKGP